MKKFTSRYLVAVLLVAVTALVVHLLQYESMYDDAAAVETVGKIPLRIAPWTGTDVHLDEEVYDILDTHAIVHRSYTSDEGWNVFLSIVHYADTKVGFHAPEQCLGGQGIQAEKTAETINISTGNGKKDLTVAEIVTDDKGARTLVYYFYKVGNFAGQNYIRMRLNVMVNKLTKRDTRGSLVRVSTAVEDEDYAAAREILRSYLDAVYPVINQLL